MLPLYDIDSPKTPVIEFLDKNVIDTDNLSAGTRLRMKCYTIGGNPAPRVSGQCVTYVYASRDSFDRVKVHTYQIFNDSLDS